MRFWKPKPKTSPQQMCEDIKKARSLLRESGLDLSNKMKEQEVLVQRLKYKPTLRLIK